MVLHVLAVIFLLVFHYTNNCNFFDHDRFNYFSISVHKSANAITPLVS